jgi:hypothetical protein
MYSWVVGRWEPESDIVQSDALTTRNVLRRDQYASDDKTSGTNGSAHTYLVGLVCKINVIGPFIGFKRRKRMLGDVWYMVWGREKKKKLQSACVVADCPPSLVVFFPA